jgi:hypothetical protein
VSGCRRRAPSGSIAPQGFRGARPISRAAVAALQRRRRPRLVRGTGDRDTERADAGGAPARHPPKRVLARTRAGRSDADGPPARRHRSRLRGARGHAGSPRHGGDRRVVRPRRTRAEGRVTHLGALGSGRPRRGLPACLLRVPRDGARDRPRPDHCRLLRRASCAVDRENDAPALGRVPSPVHVAPGRRLPGDGHPDGRCLDRPIAVRARGARPRRHPDSARPRAADR